MARCKACDANLDPGGGSLCMECVEKRLACRVCGRKFVHQDILGDLPTVQCPSCEGRAIDVLE
ncbi:MAG: hypothetical protein ACREIQ_01855 [Nitrospiria bacterium]